MYLITTATINSIEHQSMCLKKYIESCPPELKCKLFNITCKDLHDLTSSVTHPISTYFLTTRCMPG